jgi:hypothetical protein
LRRQLSPGTRTRTLHVNRLSEGPDPA